MKTGLKRLLITVIAVIAFQVSHAQDGWPKIITSANGVTIKIYPLQPQSFSGNVLKSLAAISVTKNNADPVFGSFWSTSTVETDRDSRLVSIRKIKVTALKIPSDTSKADISLFKSTLESAFPSVAGGIPLDDLLTSLSEEMNEAKLSTGISTTAPQIIYSSVPAILITIDGTPIIQKNEKLGVNEVVNTPFTIVQYEDKQFYLYGGNKWYSSSSATGPYTVFNAKVPGKLKRIEKKVSEAKTDQPATANNLVSETDTAISKIIVSTVPAELIEVYGEAQYLPVQGTSLLYVGNSPNDIFIDTQTKQYYILLAGRWYQSLDLSADSQWTYIASDKLPAGFANIPEGSAKDNVLASVAGTKEAKEAIMDAQIPQTAKVDRKTANTKVSYDGAPQFKLIEGTDLQYAVNTSSTVLFDGGAYYVVDNGIWFISPNPTGPWSVSTKRPGHLDQIPPSSPVYNTKFVDIYEITPDFIYMGYTPGYLNSYIYGPTLVYGTGFYYNPWRGRFYYPRPWSWGFGMSYNPWFGWGFGLDYGFNWFDLSFGAGFGGWYGGWWGPSYYLPTCWGYSRGFRPNHFYGHGLVFRGGTRIHTGGNIYRGRPGIRERNGVGFGNRIQGNRGFVNAHNGSSLNQRNNVFSNKQGNIKQGNTFQRNNVFSDSQGNTFRRDENGQWRFNGRQNDQQNARPANDLDRQQQFRETGQMRTQNFQRAQAFSTHMGGFSRGGFGGGFHGGGGYRGRR